MGKVRVGGDGMGSRCAAHAVAHQRPCPLQLKGQSWATAWQAPPAYPEWQEQTPAMHRPRWLQLFSHAVSPTEQSSPP